MLTHSDGLSEQFCTQWLSLSKHRVYFHFHSGYIRFPPFTAFWDDDDEIKLLHHDQACRLCVVFAVSFHVRKVHPSDRSMLSGHLEGTT